MNCRIYAIIGDMKVLVLFVMLIVGPAHADNLERLKSLQESDPAAAIAFGEQIWPDLTLQERDRIAVSFLFSYMAAKRYQEAAELADSLIQEAAYSDLTRAKALAERFKTMKQLKNWDSREEYQVITDKLGSDLQDQAVQRKLWERAALACFDEFQLDCAIKYFKQAIEIRADQPDQKQVILHSNLGAMYALSGKYAEAIEVLLVGEQLSEQLGLPVHSNIYKNLGGLYFNLEQWQRSVEYTSKAINAFPEDSPDRISLYSNLSAAYGGAEELDQALFWAKKSWELSVQLDRPFDDAANNLAYFYRKNGRYEEALEMFDTAARLYEQQKSYESLGVVNKNRAETWVELGDRQKAADLFQESYRIYSEFDYRPKRLELYQPMIENLEALGNYPRAYELMKEFKELSDETNSIESKERIAKLQSEVDLERSNKELSASENQRLRQQQEIVLLQKDQQQQRATRIYLLLLALGLSIVAILLIRSVRFRGKANRVLQEKTTRIEKQHREMETLNARLKMQSLQDPLTGLKNRRYMDEFVRTEMPYMQRALADGHDRMMLVMLIDLDDFKLINDRHGHAVGDLVLQQAAQVLSECARESDVLVRWGGEEFCWLCRDTDIEDGVNLCERVRTGLQQVAVESGDSTVNVTASIGFAPFPVLDASSEDWDRALKLADAAMYKGKHSGKDRCVGITVNNWDLAQDDQAFDLDTLVSDGLISVCESPD